MRSILVPLAVVLALPGCTATKLRTSTLQQASSLTELQYQQVLNNLAMFHVNPEAIPAHVNLRDGSAQVADLRAAGIATGTEHSFLAPNLLRSRTVVEQWGMSPVTDANELKVLRIAYRRALGFPDSLYQDHYANDLAHELKKQSPDLDEFVGQENRLFEAYKEDLRYQSELELLEKKRRPGETEGEFAQRLRVAEARLRHPAEVENPILPPDDLRAAANARERDLSERHNRLNKLVHADILNMSLSVIDENIIFKGEDLDNLEIYDVDQKVIPDGYHYPPVYVTPFAAEIRRQVKEIHQDLQGIGPGWYRVGGKKDVPKDALYVGRYRDCYVWVCPEGYQQLSEFTLKVMGFSALIQDPGILNVPGPRYTPSSGFPSL